ncbi:MAG: hypothetical protein AUK03_12590 [Anaerolineae bacterium CG2_30_64_16]|nr:MAG: hypothetical protein AUK03_12590 [Anaerolineae bacterium CG2_30_64_16]
MPFFKPFSTQKHSASTSEVLTDSYCAKVLSSPVLGAAEDGLFERVSEVWLLFSPASAAILAKIVNVW